MKSIPGIASATDLARIDRRYQEALSRIDQLADFKPGKYFVYDILRITLLVAVNKDSVDGQSGKGVVG